MLTISARAVSARARATLAILSRTTAMLTISARAVSARAESDARRPFADHCDARRHPWILRDAHEHRRPCPTYGRRGLAACRHPCLFYPFAVLTNRLPFGAPFCAVSEIFEQDEVFSFYPASPGMGHGWPQAAWIDAQAASDLTNAVRLMDVSKCRNAVHLMHPLEYSLRADMHA